MSTLRIGDISTGGAWRSLDVGPDLEAGYRAVTNWSGEDPPLGLDFVLARRAFTRGKALPPGGVLLGIEVCSRSLPPRDGRFAYKASVEVTPHRSGRSLVTVLTQLRRPDGADVAEVTFTIRWPAGPPTDAAQRSPQSSGPNEEAINDVEWAPTVELTFACDQERVRLWADVSDDRNPLHLDPGFAARTRFAVPIVHGHLLAAVVADALQAVLGEELVCGGSISVAFRSPVPVDDGIRLKLYRPDQPGPSIRVTSGGTEPLDVEVTPRHRTVADAIEGGRT